MGYNSTVLVLNDRLGEIEREPEKFVKEMLHAIQRSAMADQEDFYPGQSTVMSCAHADVVTILAVGGNHATVMGRFHNGGRHYQEEDQVKLLRELADKYGFSLRKKPVKKKQTQDERAKSLGFDDYAAMKATYDG
jgi:hypothetical protein